MTTMATIAAIAPPDSVSLDWASSAAAAEAEAEGVNESVELADTLSLALLVVLLLLLLLLEELVGDDEVDDAVLLSVAEDE